MDFKTTVETVRADALQQAYEVGYRGGKFGPGKFEGEQFYAPYFFQAALENGDEPFYDGEDVAGDPVEVTDLERAAFGLDATTAFVVVWYSPQGFISVSEYTASEYDRLREQHERTEE